MTSEALEGYPAVLPGVNLIDEGGHTAIFENIQRIHDLNSFYAGHKSCMAIRLLAIACPLVVPTPGLSEAEGENVYLPGMFAVLLTGHKTLSESGIPSVMHFLTGWQGDCFACSCVSVILGEGRGQKKGRMWAHFSVQT